MNALTHKPQPTFVGQQSVLGEGRERARKFGGNAEDVGYDQGGGMGWMRVEEGGERMK